MSDLTTKRQHEVMQQVAQALRFDIGYTAPNHMKLKDLAYHLSLAFIEDPLQNPFLPAPRAVDPIWPRQPQTN